MTLATEAGRLIAGGIIVLIGLILAYVLRVIYKGALALLRDPDTERLLDGK